MAVTKLERKGRRNKTRARVRTQNRKLANSIITVASPYKDKSGIIIDDDAEAVVVEVEQEVTAEAQAAADAVTAENESAASGEGEGEAKAEEAPAAEETTEEKTEE